MEHHDVDMVNACHKIKSNNNGYECTMNDENIHLVGRTKKGVVVMDFLAYVGSK